MVICSISYQNVKLLVQSHWDNFFQDRRGAKPKQPLLALNWSNTPIYRKSIVRKRIFPESNIFYTIRFKIKCWKTLQKAMVRKWTASKLFKKNVVYINKFRKQPLLHYSKNIPFVCSTSTKITVTLHVIKKMMVRSSKFVLWKFHQSPWMSSFF